MATLLRGTLVYFCLLLTVALAGPPKKCDVNEKLDPMFTWESSCEIPFPLCTYSFMQPHPECACIEDYARAANDTCIPLDDCPKPECKANEVRVITTVSPSYCDNKCDITHKPYPGCVCKEGYILDFDTCIPESECKEPPEAPPITV